MATESLPPITVAIVEDDEGTRENLAALLDRAPGFRCVGAFPDAESALRILASRLPEVVLMDINLLGLSGVEATRTLKRLHPAARVVMLTVYEQGRALFNSLKAGACGYLLKRTPPEKILEGIRDAHAGGVPLNHSPLIGINAGRTLTVRSNFAVVFDQTLCGAGTVNAISGGFSIAPGGILSPGLAPGAAGTLTVNGDLTLQGNTVMDVDVAGASDQVAGPGAHTYGGTLTINNLGSPLALNDTVVLFAGAGTGSFAAFVPAHANSDPGLFWKFDAATGELKVVDKLVPDLEPLQVVNQGNTNLVFSWTQSGWKLQSQTNALDMGLSTNWSDYPGGANPPVNVPIVPANPSVPSRLVFP